MGCWGELIGEDGSLGLCVRVYAVILALPVPLCFLVTMR